jgi:hypothetical protein
MAPLVRPLEPDEQRLGTLVDKLAPARCVVSPAADACHGRRR